ncbi:MAG: tyrosine--tRNA ligase [bacterium]|nr:tyrosine--tRNA ligase [bacterium]
MQKQSIKEVLTKRVAEILPAPKGLADLMKKRKIRLYLGIDPTGTMLHLGHAVVLRKLRQFQDLSHEVILLFGTLTAQIGDPSGRDKMREPLSSRQIVANMRDYKTQASQILDIGKARMKKNDEWLGKLNLEDILKLTSRVTTSQLLERDMFQGRMKRGQEIWVHELLYPLLQGYDSVAMDVDLEVGGTDQTFNMLIGRRLQKAYRSKEKFVLTVPLLLGLDGRKMSKSFGNTVNIADPPREMYGKLMTLRDELVPQYFELCSDVVEKEVAVLKKKLSPRDFKARLAKEVVTLYHGAKKARVAEQEFISIFQKKQQPSYMKEVEGLRGEMPLVDILVKAMLASSKSEARRLIQQGGVRIDGNVQKKENSSVELRARSVIQVGKRRFIRVA